MSLRASSRRQQPQQLEQAAQGIQQQVAEQLAQSSEAIRQQVLQDVGGITQQIAGQSQANANQLLRQAEIIEQLAQRVSGTPQPQPQPPTPQVLDTI